mmetsp:Transcript_64517/g.151601  ORF Transcript_64517/g.151601 Transcript_64517/m.151601 type:complete len:242 (+) Transcript_64517:3025-3750(+)
MSGNIATTSRTATVSDIHVQGYDMLLQRKTLARALLAVDSLVAKQIHTRAVSLLPFRNIGRFNCLPLSMSGVLWVLALEDKSETYVRSCMQPMNKHGLALAAWSAEWLSDLRLNLKLVLAHVHIEAELYSMSKSLCDCRSWDLLSQERSKPQLFTVQQYPTTFAVLQCLWIFLVHQKPSFTNLTFKDFSLPHYANRIRLYGRQVAHHDSRSDDFKPARRTLRVPNPYAEISQIWLYFRFGL